MSNTPPVRHDEFGRTTRNIADYLYPGHAGGGLEYSAQFFNTGQPSGLGPYRATIDPGIDGQNRAYRAEPGVSARNDSHYFGTPGDEGMHRRRSDNTKAKEMNPALGENFNKLDSNPMSVGGGSNEYDAIKNGYTSDPSRRNYSNVRSLQPRGYQDRAYQSHLQSHPSTIPGSQLFLPPVAMLPHQPFDPTSAVLSSIMKAHMDHHDYGRGIRRPANLPPPYGAVGHMPHRQPTISPFRDFDPDRNLYGSLYPSNALTTSSKKALDVDPPWPPMYTQRADAYPSNYPRSASSHSVPSKSSNISDLTCVTPQGPQTTNGLKQPDASVIDLTSSTSPDNAASSIPRNDSSQFERNNGNSSMNDPRATLKENGNLHQASLMLKEREIRNAKSSQFRHSQYPHSSGSPYASYPVTNQVSVPPYTSSHLGALENSVDANTRPLSAPKQVDQGRSSVGQHWGNAARHLTPPPRQHGPLESLKKTVSPSSQFLPKNISHAPEITFNYPESSGNKPDKHAKYHDNRLTVTPTKKDSHNMGHSYSEGYGGASMQNKHSKYMDNPAMSAKNHLWHKTDESKLSPYENLIMDSARVGKPCGNFIRKYDDARSKFQHPNMHPSNTVCATPPQKNDKISEYPIPHGTDNAHSSSIDNDVSRNSVIQSTLKLPVELEKENASKEQDTPSKTGVPNHETENLMKNNQQRNPSENTPSVCPMEFNESWKNNPPSSVQSDATKIDVNMNSTDGTIKIRNSAAVKEGEQRVKRKYVKKSDVWKNKGKGKHRSVDDKNHGDVSPNSKSWNSPCNDHAKPDEETRRIKTHLPARIEKSGRPQRKSGGLDMEEYLYGCLFSDEETENDDSSDDDYNCPIKVNKARGTKQAVEPLRRTRRSTRSQDDTFSDDDEQIGSEMPQRRQKKRRRKRKSNAYLHDETVEKMDANEDYEATENTVIDVPQKDESLMKSITEKMTQEMVKSVEISGEMKDDVVEKIVSESPAPGVEPVRKKRKYVRKLDEFGNPVKRVRKVVKSAEIVPTKRKYVKRSEKWFRNKTSDKNSNPNSANNQNNTVNNQSNTASGGVTLPVNENLEGDNRDCNEPLVSHPGNFSAAQMLLAGIEGGSQPDVGQSQAQLKTGELHYGPNELSAEHAASVTTGGMIVCEEESASTVPHNKNSDFKSTETASSLEHQGQYTTTTDAAAKDSIEGPKKIKKKPGRKLGWRKYPQQNNDTQISGTNKPPVTLRKKYKAAKGDGLKRFGRRRGRRRKFANKQINKNPVEHRPLSLIPITSTPTRNYATQKQNIVSPKRKYDNSRRLEKKRQRLLILESRGNELKKEEVTTGTPISTRNHDIHEISKHLQNEESEYNFKDISWYSKIEDDVEVHSVKEEQILEEDVNHPPSFNCNLSRPQTPSFPGTPAGQSPFPLNMKKLTYNSAIGETALHKAARLGYVENIQYYLENGASVNQCDNAGYTALHKACVHNNLEAASLLLQYGADVNKHAADGTRPFHDAVEYDNLEMARLTLACGADPMLSKFSGRAVPNMIRSEKMGRFINAYLNELKESSSEKLDEKELEWKFKCSAVFDNQTRHTYNALDFPPEAEEDDMFVEFELYEELPFTTYLLQPDEESEWTNFCLLDDYLKLTSHQKSDSGINVRIITMPTDKFLRQIQAKKTQYIRYERSQHKPDLSGAFVEIVALDENLKTCVDTETVTISLFSSTDERNCPNLTDNRPSLTSSDHVQTKNEMNSVEQTLSTESVECDGGNAEKPSYHGNIERPKCDPSSPVCSKSHPSLANEMSLRVSEQEAV